MGNAEQNASIQPVPVLHRTAPLATQSVVRQANEGEVSEVKVKRKFVPVSEMTVEYWNHGEEASPRLEEVKNRGQLFAKRADQFGLLLGGCALVMIMILLVVLYVNTTRFHPKPLAPAEVTSATVDFYIGNHAFTERVAAEKAAKQAEQGHQIHGISLVNDDLEVSLYDQMASMEEKMEEMHSKQKINEPPPPPHDTGSKPEMLIPLKPTQDINFKSPLEFNGTLPKAIQTTN